MKIRVDDSSEEPAIQLTPLIDVVFNILLFFMLATTFLEREKELGIELPRARSGAEAVQRELVINVQRDGSVTLDGRTLPMEALLGALAAPARANPRTPVAIRGDRETRHAAIVRVLDACKLAGLSNLAVGTLEGT